MADHSTVLQSQQPEFLTLGLKCLLNQGPSSETSLSVQLIFARTLYQGAHLGMNFQVTPRRLKDSLRSLDSSKVLSSSVAERYVEPLSDITICGYDFRLTNLWNANRNVSVDRFVTTSKCTARVVAQVNKHMYTFSSPLLCRTYNAPVKSTPVTVKGVTSRVLTSGSGARSVAGNGLPQCLLQTTQ